MNDAPSQDSENEQEEPRAGERLAAARKALNISVTDVAKELHLDEPKVLALEENRFEDLGAPVFAKGHMRKYAELVGVPIDDLLVDYYQHTRKDGAPPVVAEKRRQPRDISLGPWIVSIVVIAIVATAAWLWFSYEPAADTAGIEPAVLAPFENSATETMPEATTDVPAGQERAPVSEGTPAPQETATVNDEAPAAISLDAPPEVLEGPVVSDIPAAELLRLDLSFTGDCWTEVTDAAGQRLYFELGVAGSSASIAGEAPFRVLLGSSDNVSLIVDGAEYTIPASQRRGKTARLTIDKP
jgi:cytoskeleton protein RodZ